MSPEPAFLDRGDGVRLAIRHRAGHGPALVFLPGHGSDMEGAKATAIDAWAAAQGRAALRFDYSGCGRSDGAFTDGTISRWTADALAAIDAAAPGRVVLVGSSMGAWIALLIALARPAAVAAVVLVAPAPDFTQWGVVETLTAEERGLLARTGQFTRPNGYGSEPTRYTRALIDDGAQHQLLGRPFAYAGPVRILQGQADTEVPWRLSLDLAAHIASDDVQLVLVKDGDHRLARPTDLALLGAVVEALPCWSSETV